MNKIFIYLDLSQGQVICWFQNKFPRKKDRFCLFGSSLSWISMNVTINYKYTVITVIIPFLIRVMTRCLLVNYSNDICSVWIDSRNYVNLDRYPYKYLGQVWWFAFGIERYQISNIELGIGRGWSLGKHLPCLFQLCYQRFVAIRCNLKIRKYLTVM